MKQLFTLLLIAFFGLSAHSQWTIVGDPEGVNTLNTTEQVVMDFHPVSGNPTVLYKESLINLGAFIRMKEFPGDEWTFVGDSLIHSAILVGDHMDFKFSPINGNIPIVYYNSNTMNAAVVEQQGDTWAMEYPGLSNYSIAYNNGWAFDLSPTGNPTLCFPNAFCPPGPNGPGQFTAIQHNGVEWITLAFPCVSVNSASDPSMEYNPITGKLLAYHRGGPDLGTFEFARKLIEYNVSSWDSLCSPSFEGFGTNGKMEINPVNGDVYFHAIDQGGMGNFFNMFVWDGSTVEQVAGLDDLNVAIQDYQVVFHPETGDPHVVYKSADVFPQEYFVKRYNGTGWEDAFEGLNMMGVDGILDAKFDPFTNELYVACYIGFGPFKVIKYAGGTSGTQELAISPEVKLYPNPAKDLLNIEVEGLKEVRLLQLNGQVIFTGMENRIDLNGIAPGVYLCEILGDGWKVNERVIVE